MIALRVRSHRKAGSDAGSAPRAPAVIDVDEEQRWHLIECCAFFRAQRFRESGPGQYRKQDLSAAQADIDAVIKPSRNGKKR